MKQGCVVLFCTHKLFKHFREFGVLNTIHLVTNPVPVFQVFRSSGCVGQIPFKRTAALYTIYEYPVFTVIYINYNGIAGRSLV